MTSRLRFTILGCGSSPGVPRPNGDWGNCNPDNPKNFRSRPALAVERISPSGTTTVIIDTGPDFRTQMIRAGINHIDGVVYTHPHADHIHGIDDLRSFTQSRGVLLDIYADKPTQLRLIQGFGYCFQTPEGSNYPPILKAHEILADKTFTINGTGGVVELRPHLQIHGSITSLGFTIGKTAYCPDISDFPQPLPHHLYDLDVLIIDALQYERHPSHFSLDEALSWIEHLRPKRAILTHMHTPLDYGTVMAQTPDHIEPAYDGLFFEISS